MKITKLFAAALMVAIGTIFANCAGNSEGTKTASDSTSTNSVNASSDVKYTGKIAYIRMDSLTQGYGLYIDLSDEFTTKGKKVEAELTQRGRVLERELTEYQEKAQKGLITRFEAQTIESGLQQKNQSAMQYRDKMMAELQQEEVVMMNKISTAIMDFLKEYNKEKGYSMILQSTGGNPVIIADPATDITEEVITELNKRYLESKKTTANTATAEKK